MEAEGEEELEYHHFHITAENTAYSFTLQQLAEARDDPDALVICYNEQKPDGQELPFKKGNSNPGHAKAIIIFKNTIGIFISHSFPRFPAKESIEIPEPQLENAQHMIAVNIDREILEKLVQHLYRIKPLLLEIKVPAEFEKIERMGDLQKNEFSFAIEDPFYKNEDIKRRDRTLIFDIFSVVHKVVGMNDEEREYECAWYNLAKHYNEKYEKNNESVEFLIQSWDMFEHRMCNGCNKKLKNVMETTVESNNVERNNWQWHQDHSKYSISSDLKMFAMADLNHTENIKPRGGIIICLRNAKIANAFHKKFKYEFFPHVPKTRKCRDSSL